MEKCAEGRRRGRRHRRRRRRCRPWRGAGDLVAGVVGGERGLAGDGDAAGFEDRVEDVVRLLGVGLGADLLGRLALGVARLGGGGRRLGAVAGVAGVERRVGEALADGLVELRDRAFEDRGELLGRLDEHLVLPRHALGRRETLHTVVLAQDVDVRDRGGSRGFSTHAAQPTHSSAPEGTAACGGPTN